MLGGNDLMDIAECRVAIFIEALRGGGAERSTVNLANSLAERGVHIDLLLMKDDGVFTNQVSPLVNLIKVKKSRFWAALWLLKARPIEILYMFCLFLLPGSPKPLRAVPGIVNYIHDARPNVLMSVLDYGNIAVIVAKWLSGIDLRIVIGQRNQLSREYTGRSAWRRKLVIPTLRYFYKRADVIVAVSKGVALDLHQCLSIPTTKIFAIYNAVSNDMLYTQSKKELKHPWFGHIDRRVILAAGKLKPQKDFETLLRAFQIVRSREIVELVILGEGPLRSNLEMLAKDLGVEDHVSFEGFVENPFNYMRNADLFVLSSRYEGLPGVLIQALACGCPVVSTACPSGPAEILNDGQFGALVPVGDVRKLADAILAFLEATHDKRALEEHGRSFSEKAAISKYLQVMFPSLDNKFDDTVKYPSEGYLDK